MVPARDDRAVTVEIDSKELRADADCTEGATECPQRKTESACTDGCSWVEGSRIDESCAHNLSDEACSGGWPTPVVTPQLNWAVLAAAKKLCYEGVVSANLASRPEVMASGASLQQMLDALTAKGGLVHPAERLLLGQ